MTSTLVPIKRSRYDMVWCGLQLSCVLDPSVLSILVVVGLWCGISKTSWRLIALDNTIDRLVESPKIILRYRRWYAWLWGASRLHKWRLRTAHASRYHAESNLNEIIQLGNHPSLCLNNTTMTTIGTLFYFDSNLSAGNIKSNMPLASCRKLVDAHFWHDKH